MEDKIMKYCLTAVKIYHLGGDWKGYLEALKEEDKDLVIENFNLMMRKGEC